jgi:hypothetical protein
MDTASFIGLASVEGIARQLFEQLLIGFKHLVVSTLEVSTLGVIPQRIMTDPAEHEASGFVRHPKLNTEVLTRWSRCSRMRGIACSPGAETD